MSDLYADIAAITAALPERTNDRHLGKIAVELGEATDGTDTLEHVLEELADVAIAALCTAYHLTGDIYAVRDALEAKLRVDLERAGITTGAAR